MAPRRNADRADAFRRPAALLVLIGTLCPPAMGAPGVSDPLGLAALFGKTRRLLVPGSEMVRFDLGWSPEGDVHFHFASGTKPVAQRQGLR